MILEAHYSGDDEYDQTFDITNSAGEVIARCGVGLAAQIEDKPVAFDVWLQAEKDNNIQIVFLLMPYAMNDDGIYHTLSNSGKVEKLETPTQVSLSSGGVHLDAQITDLIKGNTTVDIFARPTVLDRLFGREQEPVATLTPDDYIRELTIELTIKV